MSYYDDAPSIPVYDWEIRRAIKNHGICSFCKKEILPGQKYERLFYVEDGRPNVYKCHNKLGICKNG